MRSVQQLHLYATYWFAAEVRDVLYNRFAYLRELEGFYCDEQYLDFTPPFQKWSAFHAFIAYVVNWRIREDDDPVPLDRRQARFVSCLELARKTGMQVDASAPAFLGEEPQTLPVDLLFRHYRVEYVTFYQSMTSSGRSFADASQDNLDQFCSDLWESSSYEELLQKITHEVFYLLFQNREVLLLFHEWMADKVAEHNPQDLDEHYASHYAATGALKRVTPPKWTRRAVFFRDRGMCAICGTDLSGVVSLSPIENFDHMVPLARGGLNDLTNLQLLCQPCNLKKRDGTATTSRMYEAWYDMED